MKNSKSKEAFHQILNRVDKSQVLSEKARQHVKGGIIEEDVIDL